MLLRFRPDCRIVCSLPHLHRKFLDFEYLTDLDNITVLGRKAFGSIDPFFPGFPPDRQVPAQDFVRVFKRAIRDLCCPPLKEMRAAMAGG